MAFVATERMAGRVPSPFDFRLRGAGSAKRQSTRPNGVRGQPNQNATSPSKRETASLLSTVSEGALIGAAAFGALPIGGAFADEVPIAPESLVAVDIQTLIANNQIEAAVAAGVGILALGLVTAAVQSQGGRVKGVSGSGLVDTLKETRMALIIDIRSKASVARDGSPLWGRYGKRSIALPYALVGKDAGSPDPRFGAKVARLRSAKQGTVVVLVDENGSQAPAAARQILKLKPEIKPIFYLKGGAAGWKASGLPWKAPGAAFKLPGINIPAILDAYEKNPGVYNAGLALAAAVASIAVAFSELNIFLEVVGLAAATQLVVQRLLFAEDRSETIKQLKELRDEKIAVGEAGKDLKRLAGTIFDSKKAPAAKQAKATVETTSAVTPVTESSIIQGVGAGASAVASNQ